MKTIKIKNKLGVFFMYLFFTFLFGLFVSLPFVTPGDYIEITSTMFIIFLALLFIEIEIKEKK